MRLLEVGEGEATKAAVHGALGLLALTCLVYNAAAWCVRREAHLSRNVVLYGALVAVELAQLSHHCDRLK